MKWPCFYGIDFATRAELIANGLDVEEIRRSIGADSLGYVSLDGLIAATTIAEGPASAAPASTATTRSSCPSPDLLGKHLLEDIERAALGCGQTSRTPTGPRLRRRHRLRRRRAEQP